MRPLFIPQISTVEVAAESDIYSHLTLTRAIRTIEPSYFYLWLRRGDERSGLEGADVMCLYEEGRNIRSFYQQMATLDLYRVVDLFGWHAGLYPVDCVFTSRAGIAPALQLALGHAKDIAQMPVVITEPRVYGPGAHGHNNASETQMAIRAAGYASCFGCYWSRWEKEEALTAASLYMQPSVLKRWDERAHVVDALVDVPEVVFSRESERKRLLFVGRLNTNKRYKEVVEAYGKVIMARADVEVWVHAGTGAFKKFAPSDHRWHRTSERLPREAYWRLVKTAHVGAYLSRDEGANVTVQELLASGVVMALPRRPWVEKLFWPLRYPYLTDSENDLPALLDWLLDHYDEAHTALAPFRDLIQRERSWEPFLAKVRRLVEAVNAVPRPPAYRVFRTIVEEAMDDRQGLAFSQARSLKPDYRHSVPRKQAPAGVYSCYQAVRDLDDLTSADPWLRRPEVWA